MVVSFLYLAFFILSGAYEIWRIVSIAGSFDGLNRAIEELDQTGAAYTQLQSVLTGSIIELVILSVLLLINIICIIRFIIYTLIGPAAYLLKTKTSDVLRTSNSPDYDKKKPPKKL